MVLDVRTDVFTYLKGHLPGAEYLNTETLRASEGGHPDPAALRRCLSRALRTARHRLRPPGGDLQRRRDAQHRRDVPRRGCSPASAIPRCTCWTAGSSSGSSSSGRSYSRIRGSRRPRFPIARSTPRRPSLDEVRQAMSAGGMLVDARPPDQYAGAGRCADAARAHSRGDQPLLAGRPDAGGLRTRVEDRRPSCGRRTPRRGSRRDKSIIAYCNSATEASHVHFTLRYLLGYPTGADLRGVVDRVGGAPRLPVATGCAPSCVGADEDEGEHARACLFLPSSALRLPVPICIAIPLRSCPGRQIGPPRITSSTASRFRCLPAGSC